MALIDIQGVSRVYQGVIAALADVTLAIEAGERVALLGPSGSGKSTLLSLMAGFDVPDRGRILLDGKAVDSIPEVELHTRWIGMLFQQFHLLESLSPLENIELALIPSCKDRRARRVRSRELIRRVGLESRVGVRVRDLSGGERQRVAFCRSIANSPELLLADEPTGNLDSASKQGLLELMREHNERDGKALVVATHDPDVAAICHRVVRLMDGRLV